jgi:hypothetical protein
MRMEALWGLGSYSERFQNETLGSRESGLLAVVIFVASESAFL